MVVVAATLIWSGADHRRLRAGATELQPPGCSLTSAGAADELSRGCGGSVCDRDDDDNKAIMLSLLLLNPGSKCSLVECELLAEVELFPAALPLSEI